METGSSLRGHKNRSLPPALGQSNPVHAANPISSRSIVILYFYLRLGLPSGLFS
jgi:hypothetical protein